MSTPDTVKPRNNGFRGVFLLVFVVVIAGLGTAFWFLFRELQLQKKLADTKVESSARVRAELGNPSRSVEPDMAPKPARSASSNAAPAIVDAEPQEQQLETETETGREAVAADATTELNGDDSRIRASGPVDGGINRELGMIRGLVRLNGTPPAEKSIASLLNDPQCGRLHTTDRTTRFYVVNNKAGLADVFVQLKNLLVPVPAPSAKPVVIDQVGCEYIPYVVGIQSGQSLEVRNSDPLLHNVHFTPAIRGNRESNKAQLPKSAPLLYRFDQPEIFLRLRCDVHPWMFSYICVAEGPYFAVTDENGAFLIANVPPGDYLLEVHHRKAGTATRTITVAAAQTAGPTAVMLELNVAP